MKVRFDQESDLLYAVWGNTEGATAKEVAPGIHLLFNAGEPVAVEILFLHRRPGFDDKVDFQVYGIPKPEWERD